MNVREMRGRKRRERERGIDAREVFVAFLLFTSKEEGEKRGLQVEAWGQNL